MWTAREGQDRHQVRSQAETKEPGSAEGRWQQKGRTQLVRQAARSKGPGWSRQDRAATSGWGRSQATWGHPRREDGLTVSQKPDPWAGTPGWKEDTKVKKWAPAASPYGGRREHLEISFLQRQLMLKRNALLPAISFYRIVVLKGSGKTMVSSSSSSSFFLKAGPQSYYLWEWWIDSAS